MIAGNKIFLGLSVNAHPSVIKENNSPDLSNVLVNENKAGLLTNMPGMEKYNNIGFDESVVAIHQLNGHIFTLAGDSFWEGYPTTIVYTGVDSPCDVKCSGYDITVGDSGNNRITILSQQGGCPEHLGQMEFAGVGGVDVLQSKDICACDSGGNRIIVFDWGVHTVQATLGGFMQPKGISVDNGSPNYFYIANTQADNIIKTQIDGSGWTALGGFSIPEGIFGDDVLGYIYVANTGADNIVKTKIDGSNETILGGFSSPKGIFVDTSTGYIYVANTGADNIIKTKIDGSGWSVLAGFDAPEGVCYANGYAYVADTGNNRIVKAVF